MPAPRRRVGFVVLYFLWALVALGLLGSIADDFTRLNELTPRPPELVPEMRLPSNYPPYMAEQMRQQRQAQEQQRYEQELIYAERARGAVNFHLACNLWALLGAVVLAVARFNPFKWGPGRRIVWGGFALAFVLGRPLVGWLDVIIGIIPPGPMLEFLKVGVAPPMLLWLAGLTAILLISAVVGTAFAILVGVPATLFNQILQFEIAAQIFRHKRSGLIGYIVGFGYWLAGETAPVVPDDTRGARFATPTEVAALNDSRGMGFGQVEGAPLFLHTEKHVLIQASTRSGKGTTLLLPHLLRYQGSVFCLDPKGENAKASGRYRESVNDKTHYLDPFGLSGKPRSRFNPIKYFTSDNMEASSKALAGAFIIRGAGKGMDHWEASAQQLLALCILWVFLSDSIAPRLKDLVTVRRTLLSATRNMLTDCTKMKSPGNLLSDLAASFLATPEKEFGSILSHAQRNTEILDNPYISACVAAEGEGEEVDFADWRRGTMSVFACLSAPKFPVFNRWLRLVLTSGLDTITDRMDPPPLPVAYVLDEIATLGHLEALENAVGLSAGYGCQLIYIYQDLAQMHDQFKGRWASFISNAGVRALFNLDDYDTAEYWSKTVGFHRVDGVSREQSVYGITKGQSVKEESRGLLTPEEIMLRFSAKLMLVLPQGSHPIITERVPYFEDATLAGRWDDPRVAVPMLPAPQLPRDMPASAGATSPLEDGASSETEMGWDELADEATDETLQEAPFSVS